MSADLEQSHEVALIQVGDDAPGPQKGQVGLNHMAWRMESLEDLDEFYSRLKEKNWPINRLADHGVSLGIYIQDPDGNGIEVYYETPRSEWHTQEDIFGGQITSGRFPESWTDRIAEHMAGAAR